MVDASALRERLLALKSDLTAALVAGDRIETAFLARLADVAIVLRMLDAEMPAETAPAEPSAL